MLSAAEHDVDPDAFPRPFGQYLLLENFARGGMGEVYLAKIGGIAGLERYCVLKKLRSELTRDREYVTRFIDEARVVVTLNHANIAHVFDVGRVGEEYYLAMEYVSGRDVRTLQDRCRTREKIVSPAQALEIVCETLEALDYAHRRNHPLTGEPLKLVHRDVSPQNVLVSYEGEVKLIDFGLAASKLKVERTQPNVVMGKMAYMAPEQARGDPIDARADLFACGVLLYELIAGERFYEGMTANDIWQVAGKGGFKPRKWDMIDPDLAKHMAKALHPDQKRRFASCGDFRDALASHLHWRFPGSGVRGLREMMADVFNEELRRESEMLARFGKVTVAGFRTEFEETKSQSISLARADETSPTAIKAGAQLVRNEQSASTPQGPMPPPTTTPSRDVHQDPTRIAVSAKNGHARVSQEAEPDTEQAPKAVRGSTDEHPDEREHTMRVARARGPSGPIEDRTSLAFERPPESRPRRGVLWVAAAVAVASLVVIAWFALTHAGDTAAPSGKPEVAKLNPPPPHAPPPVTPLPAPNPPPTAPPDVPRPVAVDVVKPEPDVPNEPLQPSLVAKAEKEPVKPVDTKAASRDAPRPPKPDKHAHNDKAATGPATTEKHAPVEAAPPVEPPKPQRELPSVSRAVTIATKCTPCKDAFDAYIHGANDDAKKASLGRDVQLCVVDKCMPK